MDFSSMKHLAAANVKPRFVKITIGSIIIPVHVNVKKKTASQTIFLTMMLVNVYVMKRSAQPDIHLIKINVNVNVHSEMTAQMIIFSINQAVHVNVK